MKTLGEYEETEDTTEMRSKLKGLERTRRMTVWEDSSEISNHGHVLYMTNTTYDPAVHLTDEDYLVWRQHQSTAHVEKPAMYMIARCSSSDADQLCYSQERRLNCLYKMDKPTRACAVSMQNDLMTLSMFISVDGGGKRRTKKHHRERGKGKVEALLPANLTHSLKWNSFINTAGGKWGNMPLDLRLEQNTLLKAFLKHLGTNLNETNAAELQIVLELIRSVPASLATVLKDMPRQTESLTWNTGEKFSGLRVMSSRHCAGDGERGIVGVVLTPFKHHPGSFGEMRNIPKILEEHLGLKEVAGKLLQLEARESALRTEEESGLWTGVNQDLMSNDEKVESNGSEAGLI
ncbi:hypothetical protein Bbelb_048330 [Branchiostoma belcheri]|nr:hypothetical protein Bbelb_048330 [Branchiostoma belcheri]